MSFENDNLPLLTVQELRTAHAPRLYRPHHPTKAKTFDWDAITPTCNDCGTRTGQVNTTTGLCPTCDPTYVAPAPAPAATKAPTPRRARPAQRKPAPKAPKVRRPIGRPKTQIDTTAVIEAYTGGQSITDIANALQVGYPRIRTALLDHHVPLRNDRGRHWSTKRAPQPHRPEHHAGVGGLKAQISELGITVPELKSWALAQGLIHEIAVGPPPRRIVDAYAAAHRQDGAA